MSLAYFHVLDGPDGRPDNSLPRPGHPGHPDNGLPDLPGVPDNSLPPVPPGSVGIWPPLSPGNPVQPVPPMVNVPPGTIWPSPGNPDNSLPLPTGKFWVIAGIPGVGWRYICIDPSLKPGNALPPSPPTATPKL